MQYDLAKAVGAYISEEDKLTMIGIGTENGVLTLSCTVVRNDEQQYFKTQVISAGGYNIQCFHYRYIVSTKMRKLNYNAFEAELKAKKNQDEQS